MLLLMAFTVGMMIVRSRKPLENNWPMLYWVLVLLISIRWSEETWDFRLVLAGAAAGFLLRFEFMNTLLTRFFQVVEFGTWICILYLSFQRITT